MAPALEALRIPAAAEVESYLERLAAKYTEAIEEIWILGSRVNPTCKPPGDWDFLVFADEKTLRDLREDVEFSSAEIDLLVCFDERNFESPWPRPDGRKKRGSLYPYTHDESGLSIYCDGWRWLKTDPSHATYMGNNWRENLRAFRIYVRPALRAAPE